MAYCVPRPLWRPPFQGKIASLTRTFTGCVKFAGKMKSGTCHLCMAGHAGLDFESCNATAPWRATIGDLPLPWANMPYFLTVLPTDRANVPGFLKLDIWHCFHLGCGRSFISSSVAEILPSLPGVLLVLSIFKLSM